MEQRVIVALDGMSGRQAIEVIEKLSAEANFFKVGREMIARGEADPVVATAYEKGVFVFWDEKMHDIPATAKNTFEILVGKKGIGMFNAHCLGGYEMLKAVADIAKGAEVGGTYPTSLGVTILTSHTIESLQEVGLITPNAETSPATQLQDLVIRLALLAKKAGMDGVIASPQETASIRQACGNDFLIVTPGVRPTGSEANDQHRIMTPAQAIEAGADYLVIGRPITQPKNGTMLDALQRINEEVTIAVEAKEGKR